MEYIALYIRPHKRCQYKKNFNCFWCVLLIWKCLQTCHLPPSRLPFYWTPPFFVILGLFSLLSSSGLSRGSPLQIPVSSTGMTKKKKSRAMTVNIKVIFKLFFLSCHPQALFSLLSYSGLTRGSLDCRLKADNDKKEKKARQ